MGRFSDESIKEMLKSINTARKISVEIDLECELVDIEIRSSDGRILKLFVSKIEYLNLFMKPIRDNVKRIKEEESQRDARFNQRRWVNE